MPTDAGAHFDLWLRFSATADKTYTLTTSYDYKGVSFER